MKPHAPIEYFEKLQRDALDHDARHRNEVALLARLATNEERRQYLSGVREYRGEAAADRLRRDVWEAMKTGVEPEPIQESLV